MNAEDWLRVVESKFELLTCSDNQKVIFAAQQLQGPASSWWACYKATQPAGEPLDWGKFKQAFRAQFIPPGLVRQKAQEFLQLKQGGRTVVPYVEAFQHLSQYAPTYVDNEEMKRQYFLDGLNSDLAKQIVWQSSGSLNDLVNAAISQEGANRRVESDDRKRKATAGPSGSQQPQKFRMVYTSPTGQKYRSAPQSFRPSF